MTLAAAMCQQLAPPPAALASAPRRQARRCVAHVRVRAVGLGCHQSGEKLLLNSVEPHEVPLEGLLACASVTRTVDNNNNDNHLQRAG